MFIKIDQYRINYQVVGEGYPVVLIHGWAVNLESLTPIAADLSKKFKVYSLDLPGFGKSSSVSGLINSEGYSVIVAKFLKKLDIEAPIVIGHSLGGKIGSFLSVNIQVKGLVLIGSPGIILKNSDYSNVRNKIVGVVKQVVEKTFKIKKDSTAHTFLANLIGSEDYKNAKGNMREILKTVINEDLTNVYKKIKVPAIIIHGNRDRAVPTAVGEKIASIIQDSRLEIVEAGHFPFILPAVRKTIADFALGLVGK